MCSTKHDVCFPNFAVSEWIPREPSVCQGKLACVYFHLCTCVQVPRTRRCAVFGMQSQGTGQCLLEHPHNTRCISDEPFRTSCGPNRDPTRSICRVQLLRLVPRVPEYHVITYKPRGRSSFVNFAHLPCRERAHKNDRILAIHRLQHGIQSVRSLPRAQLRVSCIAVWMFFYF